MQTIHITPKTGNFSVIGNDLLASTLPEVAYKVLCYLLSRPKDWRLMRSDLKRTLHMTGYKVQKALKILQACGYIFYRRNTSGHTRWDVFDTPQPVVSRAKNPSAETTQNAAPHTTLATEHPSSPENTPNSDYRNIENSDDLIKSIIVTKTETTTLIEPEPLPTLPENVVVERIEDIENLQYPKQLNEPQKKAAKAVIQKVQKQEIKQEVLFALAYALASGKVNNPIGYLTALVQRANNGTFTPANPPKMPPTVEEIMERERKERERVANEKVDNLTHFKNLVRQFGDSVLSCIPEEYRAQVVV
jgi:hypothetical protein